MRMINLRVNETIFQKENPIEFTGFSINNKSTFTSIQCGLRKAFLTNPCPEGTFQ
jgi:hypothetical protein